MAMPTPREDGARMNRMVEDEHETDRLKILPTLMHHSRATRAAA
jgi:hypothetical protein